MNELAQCKAPTTPKTIESTTSNLRSVIAENGEIALAIKAFLFGDEPQLSGNGTEAKYGYEAELDCILSKARDTKEILLRIINGLKS